MVVAVVVEVGVGEVVLKRWASISRVGVGKSRSGSRKSRSGNGSRSRSRKGKGGNVEPFDEVDWK